MRRLLVCGVLIWRVTCVAVILLAIDVRSARAQTATVSLVQHASRDAGSTASSSLAFASGNTAGHFIAVAVRGGASGETFSVGDSNGNTYRQAVQLNVTVDAPYGDTLAIFYAENVRGGANTIAVSDGNPGSTLRFAILEYAGVALTNSLEGQAAAQGVSTSPSTGAVSTSAGGDLLLGAIMSADGRSYSPGSGYSIEDRLPDASNTKLITEDRIQTAAGASAASATLSSANPWGAVLAAFRAAASPPSAPDVTLTKTHAGTFTQGQSGATYTLAVKNSGTGPTAGTVTVVDTVPAGLVPTAATGSGWGSGSNACAVSGATVTCTRSDALPAQATYPAITLSVNVASTAPASVTNSATVSGGGDSNAANNTATDVTPIESAGADPPSLTLVQHVSRDAGSAAASSLGFATSNTAGNFIAVVVRGGASGETFAVSDSNGNTYRQAVQLNVTVDVPSGDTLAIFYAENIRAGANSITVTDGNSASTLRVAILEYSGVATSNSLDGGSAAQGVSASPSSGSVSTTANGDLLLGAVMSADGRGFTAGAGYTIRDWVPDASSTKLITEDRTQPGTGTASTTAALSSSNPWGAVLAAFRAGAPASPTPDLRLTKTHAGTFTQGQTGATYTLSVANSGSAATSGTVAVVDTLPTGLVATNLAGAGWTCALAALRCSRGDALPAGLKYPDITLTVNVSGSAPGSVVNTAMVGGGGDTNTGNDTASDVTAIAPAGDTQPPTAPGALTSSASGTSAIDLDWNASSDNVGVTAYHVERCEGTGCTSFVEIASVSTGPIAGPLSASANPNYFKDASGTPVILNGSHTWNNLQDWGANGILQPLDFSGFVNMLVAHGHNFTLLWRTEMPKFCGLPTGASTDFIVSPQPWQRTGPGNATDGGPKFDLTKFDQAYFDRLRTRAQTLNDAGVYAGVYLFTGEWLNVYRCSTDGYPFTGANNVNGISDGYTGGNSGTGSMSMTAPNAITDLQDAYVRKVIDTLNDLPNVLWIVSEEGPGNSIWWNNHLIAQIHAYEAGKPLQHPVGYAPLITYDQSPANSDADWIATDGGPTCGSGTPPCKVAVNDSDHTYFGMWNDSAQTNRSWAWGNFTNGIQVVFMDPYVVHYPRESRNLCPSATNGICSGPDARWNNFRDTLGEILRYSRKLNLANVLPRSSLCSTGHCLAQTPSVGAEYLVYAPSGGSFTVNLSAMPSARTLAVEWLNPSTGATVSGGSIAAGSSSQSFTPPFSGDAVLYLVDSAGHAGPTSSPTAPSTAYHDAGLAPGTYRYRVRATDAAGNLSGYSNVASATLDGSSGGGGGSGGGAISLVQHTSVDAGASASASLAFPSGNTAGNFIAVAVRAGASGETFAVSDSRGNTYRKAVQLNVTVDTPSGDTLAIFYAENIGSGPNTVTVSDAASGSTLRIAILEYSGVAAATSFDGGVAAQGVGASPSSGPLATTGDGDLLLGAIMSASGQAFTAGSGFAIEDRVPNGSTSKLVTEDAIQPLAGNASATASTGGSDAWGVVLAAFRAAGGGSSGGGTLSIAPRTTVLTPNLSQPFTTAGGNGTVTWAVDGVPGGTASSGTISASGVYSPPSAAGTHTVTATDQGQSANATVYVSTYPGTFTRDVDNLRTGLNSRETVLAPANVNATQFGRLYNYAIDGVSDASPLYVAGVNIPGKGQRNVVYVATEHDSVYAFDADGLQSAPLWHVSFIDPAHGVTTVPPGDTGECCDIAPEIGITGSPVIDGSTNTLYVVAKTKEVTGGSTKYVHRLHALDITTGGEKFGGPIAIQATVAGTGDGSTNGQLPFISLRENQRAALLLGNNVVYMAFAGHGDRPPYHGWVLGYNKSTLQQVMAFNATRNAEGGGIWQSGDGLATDASGNIFFVTGDGTFDANGGGPDLGDSIVKISPSGGVLDYFTPHDQATMDANDIDLGSGGTILLPDQPGAHPHLALSAGKNGTIYVVDRDNMGHYRPGDDNQIVQSIVNIFPGWTYTTGNFKAPVYWNGNLYFSADADYIKAFHMSNGLMSTTPTSQSPFVVNYPGATLGLSSNGTTNAILWVVERIDVDPLGSGTRGPGVLHAFDATNLGVELYNSNQAGGRDTLDYAAKWAAPLVANGKVFVASNGRLTAFGLLP